MPERVIDIGPHPGEWCNRGAHDACTGSWQGTTCSCSCHVGDLTIDTINSKVNLSVGDKKTLLAFAAFLRYAGPRAQGNPKVPLNREWYDWLTGKGPVPDPDSEVGPEPWVDSEQCGGNGADD